MRCDNCGGKYKRVFIDRLWYSFRFCKRCNIRYSVKEVRENEYMLIFGVRFMF